MSTSPFHVLAGSLRPDTDILIADGVASLVTDVEWPATGNPYAIRVHLADGRTVDTYSDRTVAIV